MIIPQSQKPRFLSGVNPPRGVATSDLVFSMHRDDWREYERDLCDAGTWPPTTDEIAEYARRANAKREAAVP